MYFTPANTPSILLPAEATSMYPVASNFTKSQVKIVDEVPLAILYSLAQIIPPLKWRNGFAPAGASKLAMYTPIY